MNVAELLDELGMGEDVEVVIARLPELASVSFEDFGSFAFQDADGCREWTAFWFGEEKVDVLGHEDVAEDEEVVSLTDPFKSGEEGAAGVIIVEVGKPVVTTEGEEVMLASGLVSLQTARHRTRLWSWVEKEM